MSYLGTRNAVALGVSQHMTLGGSNLLETLSPSLLLQFVGAETLDPRITFTRSTTATFTGSDGLIQTAAINAPRFDYNPTTLASLGLLIEEQRTNLLLYSTDLSTGWSKATALGASWFLNAAVAPDGTITALQGNAITGTGITTTGGALYRVGTAVSASTAYTFSVFVRAQATTVTNVRLRISEAGGNNTTSSDFTVTTAWTRISMSVTTAAGATSISVAVGTGSGTADLFIWGAQLEAGAFATSYIPTVASQVTRAADVAVMTGTNFSDWYNATEGTLFANFVWEGLRSVPGQRIMSLDDGTTTTSWGMSATSSNTMQNPVVIAGTTDAVNSTPTTSYAPFTSYKQAVALALNNSVGAINGVAGTTDTVVGVPPGLIAARFAGSSTGTISNIWFSQLVYYPRRLSNAELQAITS